jgi:hypothetical protein
MFTDYGKEAVAWAIGSDISNNHIQTMAIGIGSATVTASDVSLVNEQDREMITGSPDFTTAKKITFQGDFNSVQMSGLDLMEFGLFASGTDNIGSCWQREGFGSIVFDGTNELQILSTIEVI